VDPPGLPQRGTLAFDTSVLQDINLGDLLSRNISVLGHIPKANRVAVADAFSAALSCFCSAPSTATAFLVLAFPKLVLPSPGRGGKRHRSHLIRFFDTRLKKWHAGQFRELLESSLKFLIHRRGRRGTTFRFRSEFSAAVLC
jgi:hypothetical protein